MILISLMYENQCAAVAATYAHIALLVAMSRILNKQPVGLLSALNCIIGYVSAIASFFCTQYGVQLCSEFLHSEVKSVPVLKKTPRLCRRFRKWCFNSTYF
jgi:hypothetical protein